MGSALSLPGELAHTGKDTLDSHNILPGMVRTGIKDLKARTLRETGISSVVPTNAKIKKKKTGYHKQFNPSIWRGIQLFYRRSMRDLETALKREHARVKFWFYF